MRDFETGVKYQNWYYGSADVCLEPRTYAKGILSRVEINILPLKKSEWTAFSLAARSISSPVLPPACHRTHTVLMHEYTKRKFDRAF